MLAASPALHPGMVRIEGGAFIMGEGRLRLSEWYERMTARASFRSTAP